MPNPEGIATGTSLNRDDAVCRALRLLMLAEVRRVKWHGGTEEEVESVMSLYEEIGGVTSDE